MSTHTTIHTTPETGAGAVPAARSVVGPCGITAGQAAGDLAAALTRRLTAVASDAQAVAHEGSHAYGLVTVEVHAERWSVHVPEDDGDELSAELAGRWVCERGGVVVPSVLRRCAPADSVAAWAAGVIAADAAVAIPSAA